MPSYSDIDSSFGNNEYYNSNRNKSIIINSILGNKENAPSNNLKTKKKLPSGRKKIDKRIPSRGEVSKPKWSDKRKIETENLKEPKFKI